MLLAIALHALRALILALVVVALFELIPSLSDPSSGWNFTQNIEWGLGDMVYSQIYGKYIKNALMDEPAHMRGEKCEKCEHKRNKEGGRGMNGLQRFRTTS